jgi:RND family efflux transporter MFP subunit
LADYSVRAPFDGTMASVPIQKGDNTSSGTILGTIITTQQVATISLNEIDIAKIQLGQKVTLTFDAVPDLTITGKVAQIDSLGTVSQGVVNYNVKISFDTNDTRIKPGMSVNAAIITNVAQDVLTVPNSAIKTGGGVSYVQMFDTILPVPIAGVQGSPSTIPPRNQTVEVGISNGTSTEIISGLKEGDKIVTKTTITSTATTTTVPSILGNPGGGNRGGGALRIGG